MENAITINADISAPIEKVWQYWTEPQHIMKLAFADDTWEAPRAENDLRTGGKFFTRMQAKDGSAGFDFSGVYTEVKEYEVIAYEMDDGRQVRAEFSSTPDGVHIEQTFQLEGQHSEEQQRSGWQAILNNFKSYVESN